MGTTMETRMALPYWNHNASYYGWVRREVAGSRPCWTWVAGTVPFGRFRTSRTSGTVPSV